MSGLLFYAAALACLVTLGILVVGIIRFGTRRSQGVQGAQVSNRLMRWRIIAQFVAIILVVLTVLAIREMI
jgi:hypothetical protein